ncbi:PREDICTED: uncharacterized protein LOC109226333 [Nicotiana attenuata]|uniref:Uncharacterized protein n=1 Tax=Nicotiana attenuata TaxID=49451 RepID=A0A1J6IXH1_NICAT|nr:PREDICTED: uncharacterized protein LOC109226333 [Nicotiana attenuata]OIT03475.1 hypothetical protein A4A49_20783 [Nicotiana attenuata]
MGGPMVMVIEYLESSMSKRLLCKFPDNSAYDFDYSQSSIWSPLVPPPLSSSNDRTLSLGLSRKLSYEEEAAASGGVIGCIKRKFSNVLFDNLKIHHKLKKRKRKGFDFSPVPSSSKLATTTTTPRKGWAKVLKAASKHFKKKSKKKDSIGRLNLSNCLTENSLSRSSAYP